MLSNNRKDNGWQVSRQNNKEKNHEPSSPVRRNRALAWPAFNDLEQHLERVFNTAREQNGPLAGAWAPAVDIHETDDAYQLQADLPGLTREDIEVKVIEDRVTIRGTASRRATKKKKVSSTGSESRVPLSEASAFAAALMAPR